MRCQALKPLTQALAMTQVSGSFCIRTEPCAEGWEIKVNPDTAQFKPWRINLRFTILAICERSQYLLVLESISVNNVVTTGLAIFIPLLDRIHYTLNSTPS
jgi:hypothetical protein